MLEVTDADILYSESARRRVLPNFALKDASSPGAVCRLVVVGCTTDACIDMTCRGAVRLGLAVVLVKDGHTTRDDRFLKAVQSSEYYNVVLDSFGAADSVGNGEHEVTLAAFSRAW